MKYKLKSSATRRAIDSICAIGLQSMAGSCMGSLNNTLREGRTGLALWNRWTEGGFKAKPGPSHKAEHSPHIVEQDSMVTHSRVSSG